MRSAQTARIFWIEVSVLGAKKAIQITLIHRPHCGMFSTRHSIYTSRQDIVAESNLFSFIAGTEQMPEVFQKKPPFKMIS